MAIVTLVGIVAIELADLDVQIFLVKSIGQCGGCWLVDYTLYRQSRDLSGLLGG